MQRMSLFSVGWISMISWDGWLVGLVGLERQIISASSLSGRKERYHYALRLTLFLIIYLSKKISFKNPL